MIATLLTFVRRILLLRESESALRSYRYYCEYSRTKLRTVCYEPTDGMRKLLSPT